MSDANKSKTAEEEKADDTSTEEETEGTKETTEEETEESEEDNSEDEEESKENDDNEIDYDAEIDAERKQGKPDPDKARQAFLDRKKKREESEGEEDKPLTKRELQEILAAERKHNAEREAFSLARALAGSDKEAQLVVEKWKNRSFPDDLSLADQIEESYAITHRKKLLGERNEALRALKSKDGVNKTSPGAYREGQRGATPKTSAEATSAFKMAGFTWNGATRQFEKKLPNGDLLIRDTKTRQTHLIKAR